MMGRIIRLHGDPHEETQALLPWYVTGRLDSGDLAKVEAHLGGCAECQAELKWERLAKAEIAALPTDVELGWTELRRRMNPEPPRRPRAQRALAWPAVRPWLGWALAAQALIVLAFVTLAPASRNPAPYRTLGSAPNDAAAGMGNLIVIFRPDTPERELRHALKDADARLVDGPTAADAYVLRVPAAERPAALAKLRRRAGVLLAEPLDGQGVR